MVFIVLLLVWSFLFLGVNRASAYEEKPSFAHLFADYSCRFTDDNYGEMKCEKKGFQHVMDEEIGMDYWFAEYAEKYNVSETKLRSIAYCESTFNPRAENYIYVGLFQFAPATWRSNRRAMGLDEDIDLRYDVQESIRTAAYKIGRDGTGAWPVCQYR